MTNDKELNEFAEGMERLIFLLLAEREEKENDG